MKNVQILTKSIPPVNTKVFLLAWTAVCRNCTFFFCCKVQPHHWLCRTKIHMYTSCLTNVTLLPYKLKHNLQQLWKRKFVWRFKWCTSSNMYTRGGGGTPPKIVKNMIFWHKIVIFHTKYPKKIRTSLRSAQFFQVLPPLTWNPGCAPVYSRTSVVRIWMSWTL
jgi:hypothetical protein